MLGSIDVTFYANLNEEVSETITDFHNDTNLNFGWHFVSFTFNYDLK